MSRKNSKRKRYLLRNLNLFGLDHLDPVILAALADCQPLLLIGAHGTAKSELLNRVAVALDLEHRHYNASLISFDDLLGYPVPNKARTGLDYLRTPADLWDAESVFLDEISRCRPEHQNKLFSIIHERRIQGLPLEKLRYRWSAMNPPLSLYGDDLESEGGYQGSLPLDIALADRFPYVVLVPEFSEINARARRQIISGGGIQPGGDCGLPKLIQKARIEGKALSGAEVDWATKYVDALVMPLRDAGIGISGRRAVHLARSVISLYAACRVLGRQEDLVDAAFLTLKWGLPQRAQGLAVLESKVTAVHRAAVKAAGEPENGIWQHIRDEKDPVVRVALGLAADDSVVDRIALSQLFTDAWAGLSLPERYVFSRNLLLAINSDRLTASTWELLMEPAEKVLQFSEKKEHQISIHRNRTSEWDRVLAAVHSLQKKRNPEAVELGNILYTLFAVENESFSPHELVQRDQELWRLFRREGLKEAA